MDAQTVILGSLAVFFTTLTVTLVVKMWCCEAREFAPETDTLLVLPAELSE